MRYLFWNTHRNDEINNYISKLVEENNIDIVMLAEYTAKHDDLMERLKVQDCNYEEMYTEGAKELAIFGRNVKSSPADHDKNYTIQVLNESIILCVVHLPSRIYSNSEENRRLLAGQIVKCLETLETKKNIENTIVVGDFNTNPYEIPCVQANYFHGIPSYQDAKRGYRRWMNGDYKMFYNPMWNLLGDFEGIPGTYYYTGDGVESTYWHMLDQVIFRPALYKGFKKESLKILTGLEKINFLDDNNRPNKEISDHLPIVFEIEEVINE